MALLLSARMVRRRPCRDAAGTPAEIEADLASARKQIDDMRKRIANEADDANLQQLYGTAVDIQAKAEAAAETLAPQLASVAARLNELGAPPEGSKEAPDVAAQRLSLETSRRGLDAQIKLAKLLSVDAGQTAERRSCARSSRPAWASAATPSCPDSSGTNSRASFRATWNASARCETISMKPQQRHPPGACCCWRHCRPGDRAADGDRPRAAQTDREPRADACADRRWQQPRWRCRPPRPASSPCWSMSAGLEFTAVRQHLQPAGRDGHHGLFGGSGWAAPCCRPAIRPGACRPSAMPWRRG